MTDINPDRIPRHVAIIMDGNGRWAKKKGFSRVSGHEEGTESVRIVVRESRKLGIKWLTLYAFSEENWKRPRYEIDALMRILKRFLKSELNEMLENGIRFQTIGNTEKLPKDVQGIIQDTIEKTSHNSDMTLTLALSYGGRQEISLSVRKIMEEIRSGALRVEQITEDLISNFLYTGGMPDPDLLIRTSGEYRVSNFLLWQIAYTEIYITPVLWPDFRKEEYLLAIEEFQKRERRFGSSGE
jgi:undecaprenyl diphosphate synthase